MNLYTSPIINDIITPSVDYNQWLERLNTQVDEPIIQNSIKVPEVIIHRIRKLYCNTLGTSVINSLMSPSLFAKYVSNYKVTIEKIKFRWILLQKKNNLCTLIRQINSEQCQNIIDLCFHSCRFNAVACTGFQGVLKKILTPPLKLI